MARIMSGVVYEFSRPFNADKLNIGAPRTETVTANEAERAALAKRFGILGIGKLTASMTLTRMPDAPAVISVEGRVQGAAVQACVVTLEPVAETVDEPFDTLFASVQYVEKWLAEHPDDDLDAPEELDNGYMDLGELAAQYFSLALNPYPRKEGLEFADDSEAVAAEQKKENPFAVLSVLRDGK